MEESINITDAELEIMKIIWTKPGVTAKTISDELEDKTKWSQSTIKTLLGRLCNKNVISFQKKGKEFLYHAIISYEKYSAEESKSFLEKMFNGSINLMMLNFVKSKGISHEEAEELKDILSKAQKDGV